MSLLKPSLVDSFALSIGQYRRWTLHGGFVEHLGQEIVSFLG